MENTDSRVVKEAYLSINLEEGIIKRKLVYLFDNSENPESYETYLRVLVPENSGFGELSIITANNTSKIAPELSVGKGYKEAGVFVVVPAASAVGVVVGWESSEKLDYQNAGTYLFNWRKQTGVDPISVQVSLTTASKLRGESVFNLTDEGVYRYNTTLKEDLREEVGW